MLALGLGILIAAAPGTRASDARKLAWIPGVVGGALVVTGAVFLASASTIDNQIRNNEVPSQTNVYSLGQQGRTQAIIGWACGGVGAAALVTAGIMYWAGAPEGVHVGVAPTPSGGTLILVGTFR